MSDHDVYPDGPLCAPECPGDWSQWHEGYAFGHEMGERYEREMVAEIISKLPLPRDAADPTYIRGWDNAVARITKVLLG